MGMMQPGIGRRLQLPQVKRASVAGQNLFHAPRRPLDVALAGMQGQVATARTLDPVIPDARLISFALDGHAFRLRCPGNLLHAVLHALDPALPSATLPSDDLLALLLQLAAAPLPLEVQGIAPDSGRLADAHPVTLHAGGRTWAGELAGDLAAWPMQAGLPPSALALALPAAVCLGTTGLTAGMVASLQAGDAVLLETGLGVRQPAWLAVAGSWRGRVVRTGNGWQLTEAPHPAAGKDGMMADTGDGGGLARPEDVPVLLAFEVGRTELTVGAFARLGPGSILELGRGAAELVEIRANGRSIGRGELVEVEGTVAVRIVRLFDAG